jgi:hypothetical protein
VECQAQVVDRDRRQPEIAVNQQFTAQIRALRAQWDIILSRDIADFNALLKQRGLPNLSQDDARQ